MTRVELLTAVLAGDHLVPAVDVGGAPHEYPAHITTHLAEALAAKLDAALAAQETLDHDEHSADWHAVSMIKDLTHCEGTDALAAWSALQPLIGHLQREALAAQEGERAVEWEEGYGQGLLMGRSPCDAMDDEYAACHRVRGHDGPCCQTDSITAAQEGALAKHDAEVREALLGKVRSVAIDLCQCGKVGSLPHTYLCPTRLLGKRLDRIEALS